MKLVAGMFQTIFVLLCSLARAEYATKRSAGSGFLRQSESSGRVAPVVASEALLADVGPADAVDDAPTPEELLSLSQMEPSNDTELQSDSNGPAQSDAQNDNHQAAVPPTPQLPPLALPQAGIQRNNASKRRRKFIDKEAISVRPGANDKKTDVITFGLYAKQFYDTHLALSTFTIDNVLTLQWQDDRAAYLVPDGLDSITLSQKDAKISLWMPAVVITNREIRSYELISSGTTITKDGKVTKVERSLIKAKCRFELADFPFDTQKLEVKVASSKYMLDEVKLKPSEDPITTGYAEGLTDKEGYDMTKFETYEFEEIDGSLQKSRGVMRLTVKRNLRPYEQSHMIPTFIYIAISWGVFWFPFVVQFITPRLALSILALLTFTNLSIATSRSLPLSAPFNWNDLFNQTVQSLMFCTIVFNIYSEIAFHQLKCETVARSMNHECKIFLPFLSVISIAVVLLSASSDKGMDLNTTSVVVKVCTAVMVAIYGCVCWVRLHEAHKKHGAEVAKQLIDSHTGTAK